MAPCERIAEGVGLLPGAAEAGDLQSVIEKHPPAGIACELGEGGGAALLQGRADSLGGGLLARLDEVVGDTGAPSAEAGGVVAQSGLDLLPLEFGLSRISTLPTESFERAGGLIALGAPGLKLVGNLLECDGGAFVALGEFLEIGREFDRGRGDSRLRLGERDLGGGFRGFDALGVACAEFGDEGFQGAQEGAMAAGNIGAVLQGPCSGAL